MGIDALILLAAFVMLPPRQALLSLLGGVALNFAVATNQQPGRYLGVSVTRSAVAARPWRRLQP